jgi:hypothetical protein
MSDLKAKLLAQSYRLRFKVNGHWVEWRIPEHTIRDVFQVLSLNNVDEYSLDQLTGPPKGESDGR